MQQGFSSFSQAVAVTCSGDSRPQARVLDLLSAARRVDPESSCVGPGCHHAGNLTKTKNPRLLNKVVSESPCKTIRWHDATPKAPFCATEVGQPGPGPQGPGGQGGHGPVPALRSPGPRLLLGSSPPLGASLGVGIKHLTDPLVQGFHLPLPQDQVLCPRLGTRRPCSSCHVGCWQNG